jgi:hypothetical protein
MLGAAARAGCLSDKGLLWDCVLHLPLCCSGKKKRKKRGSQAPLTCPVVCICNDLYAPALRPLREVSRVLTVKAPGPERLVPRLATICATEALVIDKSVREGWAG